MIYIQPTQNLLLGELYELQGIHIVNVSYELRSCVFLKDDVCEFSNTQITLKFDLLMFYPDMNGERALISSYVLHNHICQLSHDYLTPI